MSAASLPAILIADDDEDDRFMLRRALEKAEVRNPIVLFSDGEDLIQFLTRTNAGHQSAAAPCLLFLDLNMPRLRGFDVLAAMRRGPLSGLRTIVVSGSSREEDIARAKKLGAFDYLVKFPPPDVLARVVAEATRSAGASTTAGEPARAM